MNFWDEPIPQESGQLVPPSRRPPTAVGLATPPAPQPSRRFRRNSPSIRNHVMVKTLEWVSLGTAVAWLAPWTPLRVAGLIFAALGFGAGATWLAIKFVVRPVVRAWHNRQYAPRPLAPLGARRQA